MDILSNLRERLTELMDENGYTQTTLAQALGTPRPKLSLYLQGKHAPTYKNFVALITLFGCSADYLLGLTETVCEGTYSPVHAFGTRLRETLAQREMSLYVFQKRSRISWSVIYKWLGGKSDPTVYHLVQIADLLDMRVDELLGRI